MNARFGIPAAVLAVAVVVALVAGGGAPLRAAQARPMFVLDLVPDATPCADAHTVEATRAVAPGETFTVDGCWFGDASTPPPAEELGVGIFQTEILYDDTVVLAPEIPDVGTGVDDNPDLDQAVVAGSADGAGWDCSGFGVAFPVGHRTSEELGSPEAFIACYTLAGPYPFKRNMDGRLFSLTFNAVGQNGSSSALSVANFSIGNDVPSEIGSCNPPIDIEINCSGGTVTVGGEPVPTATPGPGETATVTPSQTPETTPPAGTPTVGPTPVPGSTESVALVAGCNMQAATWPSGTAVTTVAAAVSPAGALDAIWKFEPGSGRWLAYSPAAPPEVSDLQSVDRLDAVFFCVNVASTLTRPVV